MDETEKAVFGFLSCCCLSFGFLPADAVCLCAGNGQTLIDVCCQVGLSKFRDFFVEDLPACVTCQKKKKNPCQFKAINKLSSLKEREVSYEIVLFFKIYFLGNTNYIQIDQISIYLSLCLSLVLYLQLLDSSCVITGISLSWSNTVAIQYRRRSPGPGPLT